MAQICISQHFFAGPGGEARRGGARRPPPRPCPNPGRLAKNQARGQHADVPAGEAAAARRGAKN